MVESEQVERAKIEGLLLAAAPERGTELRELLSRYAPEFVLAPDSSGLTLEATGSQIRFNRKTMRVFWLLGHAAWRVFVAHCPHILMNKWTGTPIDAEMMWNDDGYPGAQAAFETFLDSARKAIDAAGGGDINWPPGTLDLLPDSTTMSIDQQAVFGLNQVALAYAFLHEIQHVIFRRSGGPELSEAQEELECDTFARKFLLDQAQRYADSESQPVDLVLMKRGMGIALGAFVVCEITAPNVRRGSSSYPPFPARFRVLISQQAIPSQSDFWVFAATLLLATARRLGQSGPVNAKTPKELCENLIDAINATLWG